MSKSNNPFCFSSNHSFCKFVIHVHVDKALTVWMNFQGYLEIDYKNFISNRSKELG